jgi:hypothetical protein
MLSRQTGCRVDNVAGLDIQKAKSDGERYIKKHKTK